MTSLEAKYILLSDYIHVHVLLFSLESECKGGHSESTGLNHSVGGKKSLRNKRSRLSLRKQKQNGKKARSFMTAGEVL